MRAFEIPAPSGRLWSWTAVGLGAALLAADSADARVMTFDGQRVQVEEFQLSSDDIVAIASDIVDDEVEFVGFGGSEGGFLTFDIDLSGNLIELKSNATLIAADGFSFGFIFTDIEDTIALFDDVVVSATGYTGDLANAVSWSGNRIDFDFDGVGAEEGAVLTLAVTFGDDTPVIPLPATLPLALAGFGALAAIARRRSTG